MSAARRLARSRPPGHHARPTAGLSTGSPSRADCGPDCRHAFRTVAASPALASLVLSQGCVLCGGAGSALGVFTPSASLQAAFNAPPGKVRSIPFAVCRRCEQLPALMTLLEDRILTAHGVRGVMSGCN
jgi:hypothetical protein